MTASKGPAAPESGSEPEIPTFEELAADPEIAALLDFEPVPRKRQVEGGWTPDLQREFIARLASHGSAGHACDEMGKDLTGMRKLYRNPLAASFRGSWHSAIDLARERRAEQVPDGPPPMAKPPTIDHRRKANPHPPSTGSGQADEGQVLNEYGEYEDEESLRERAAEAKDSISAKVLRSRRLYLMSISGEPAKRAAFEILTELPIDWEAAARLEPQRDEPFRKPNMRNPDMLLTAENGWMGDFVHGPNKRAELLADLNAWRVAQGLEPIDGDNQGDDEE